LGVVGLLAVLRLGKTGLLLVFIAAPGLLFLGQEALATDSYSASTRIEAWIILAEIVKVSPLLGLGFGNYYWFTPLFPIRGWYVRFNSHNNYVDIVAQIGLLGLACFLWFFVAIGRLGWRLRDRMPNGFARAYMYGGLAGAAGTLVVAMLGDWVLSFVYNVGLDGFKTGVLAWLFLGGLVALESLYAGDR
jgi:O-antigen ligase